jgi:formylglycine-generating enzyme
MRLLRISIVLASLATLGALLLTRKHRPPDSMVWVPSGTFLMGSPPGEPDRDPQEVQHPVDITGFWMGRHPVTQEEWLSVMRVNPSYFRGSMQLPVEGVTWYDAIAYCNQRSMQEGFKPCYRCSGAGADPRGWPAGWKQWTHDLISCDWTANGYRLPTEAEWEYACRAGTTTATAFGNTLTSRQGNFNGEFPYNCQDPGPNLQRTTPVGQYPPNPWGLSNMHGNVSQWCWDWYAPYPQAPEQNPRGPTRPSTRKVFRGGSWFSHGAELRSATRFGDAPFFRLDMLPGGLRVAQNRTAYAEE